MYLKQANDQRRMLSPRSTANLRGIGEYPGMNAVGDPEITPTDQEQYLQFPISVPQSARSSRQRETPRASVEDARSGPMGKKPKDMGAGLRGGMYKNTGQCAYGQGRGDGNTYFD